MSNSFSLRVITFKDGDAWVAQAIEKDICAQAPTQELLQERFTLTLAAELEASKERNDTDTLSGIGPAPAHFRDLWLEKESKKVRSLSVHGHDVDMALCA